MATRCSSPSTRRGRPATPVRGAASTPTCCSQPPPRARMADRRSFGAVVGCGLASAVLAAVAGRQPWAHGSAPGGFGELSATVEAGKVPAASALSLVVLACWGVLLVTRGKVRRVVAVVAVL